MTSWVNSKIVIRKAGAKGIGSFAGALINKGEWVVVQGGRIMSYRQVMDSDYRIFSDHCFQVERDFLICPIEPKRERLDGVCEINHSCTPNCGFCGQIVLVAMRDIETGEEITYDYAMTDANWHDLVCPEMICLCKTNNCRRTITGEDWRKKDLQEKYKGYFSSFIQELINQ